jgi:SAM-dependent methyltransferase
MLRGNAPQGARAGFEIFTSRAVYSLLRLIFDQVFGQQHMLHYPVFHEKGQSLLEGQIHLTRACLAHLGEITGKRMLDVGCGNGIQTLYVYDNYAPSLLAGVDSNPMHIRLALAAAARRPRPGLTFAVDDAQALGTAADKSFDLMLCTESAHHYPDKEAFLAQVGRVLRPGGRFVIADLFLREGAQLRRVDRGLALFYWTVRQYLASFPAHGLRLDCEQEITECLIKAFHLCRDWLDREGTRSGIRSRFLKLASRSIVAFYVRELKTRLEYRILAGVKD